MNNQLATRSTFVYRQGRIVLFRALRKNPVLVLVQAFFIGTLLTALPLSSHGDQDPLINVNRAVHGFNAAMDKVLLRPLASTYKAVTPRFAIRRVVIDALFNPLQQLENHHRRTVLAASEVISDRERLLGMDGLISGDGYLFIREAYLQRREFLVEDGWPDDPFADFDADFEDDFDLERTEHQITSDIAGG